MCINKGLLLLFTIGSLSFVWMIVNATKHKTGQGGREGGSRKMHKRKEKERKRERENKENKQRQILEKEITYYSVSLRFNNRITIETDNSLGTVTPNQVII